jgi:DNA mismatch repair protein MutS2
VIGCTVDEALSRADKFLDEALLADQRSVRVIHGHGTGQLRRALAEFLQGHPLVARFEPARPSRAAAASPWWS